MTLGLGTTKRRQRAEDPSVKKRTEQVLGLLAHLSLANKIVLDVGCGFGLYTLNVERVAQMAIGIDTAQGVLRYAKEDAIHLNSSAEFVGANAECMPFRDSCCDVVLVLEALEHIQYVERALKEAKRVLKSPGYLVVSVPNRRYPFEMHNIRIGKIVISGLYGSVPFFSWAPRFIRKKLETARIYTRKEIAKIIEENGFIVCQVQYSTLPRLDRLGSKRITEFCDRFFSHLENNAFFRSFGMSIFVLAQKV
jgi:ubiquinone/menaquinone biosynthesis C-methylase UbiE